MNTNTRKYWLGVVGSKERVITPDKYLWWCFPLIAKKNDKVLMYCPRSISPKYQGIYAEFTLSCDTSTKGTEKHYCAGYGRTKGSLFYAKLTKNKIFDSPFTAKEMKSTPIVRTANFVNRNFQGTVFEVKEDTYLAIIEAIETKQMKNKQEPSK